MRLVLTSLFIVFLAAGSAYAQEPSHPLRLPTMVFAGAATADWASTVNMLHRGYTEANPLLKWTQDKPSGVVALGASLDVVSLIAWNKLVGKRHPKLAAVGLYAMSAFRVGLAVNNSLGPNRAPANATTRQQLNDAIARSSR